MSKRSKKSRKTQRRNAARRAARRAAPRNEASRRHARQTRPPGAATRSQPLEALSITADGFVEVMEIPEGEVEHDMAYVEAHRLLPPHYPVDDVDLRTRMAMALFTLDDPTASPEALLHAIIILGHTPREAALSALTRYASSGAPYAGIAKCAASECDMWLRSEVALAEPAPMASAMLN